jgi:hypothetical protein
VAPTIPAHIICQVGNHEQAPKLKGISELFHILPHIFVQVAIGREHEKLRCAGGYVHMTFAKIRTTHLRAYVDMWDSGHPRKFSGLP